VSYTEDDALEELTKIVKGVGGLVVRDHEPPEVSDTWAVVFNSGGTPTDYLFQIRIYARGSDQQAVQARLRALRVKVEAAIKAHTPARFGNSNWTYESIEGTEAWVCTFDLTCGREDF
jgi:hypothetical protein